MKLKRIITLCAMAAALGLSAVGVSAQQDNGGGPGGGGFGGPGGGGFGGGRGNFDPAQMQQRMMDNIREQLNFTNDTDWSAVQPLVQAVMTAQQDARGNMRGMFGGRNRGGQGGQGGQGGGRGGMFGQREPSPEQTALQNAVEQNAPASQIKDLLAKYRASQKAKQDKLVAAQEELKKVLTTQQEAQACLMGLVN
jgi:hypothetical protein